MNIAYVSLACIKSTCAETAGKPTFRSARLIWNMKNAILLVGLCCCGPADNIVRRLEMKTFASISTDCDGVHTGCRSFLRREVRRLT